MKNELNLQNRMLGALRRQGVGVTIFLTNGFQMRGFIRGYDSFAIIVEVEGRQHMIYKHAISTIQPQRRIDLYAPREDEGFGEDSAIG